MRKFIAIPLVVFSLAAAAQDGEPVSTGSAPIATDRPTQAASAFVVPKGQLLLEAGFLKEGLSDFQTNFTYANVLVRFGVLEGVELRLTQNYVGYKILEMKSSGFSPLTLGTKIHLAEENGLKPQISLLGQITLKGGSEGFGLEKPIKEFRLNFQNTLSQKVAVGYNLGIASFDGSSGWLAAVVGSFQFVDGWTVFAEPYAYFGDGYFNASFDTGVTFLAKDNLQFDVFYGTTDGGLEYYSFLGFGVAIGFN